MIYQPDKTLYGIKIYFKLKDDKVSEPYFYLVLAYLECKTHKVNNAGQWNRIITENQQ